MVESMGSSLGNGRKGLAVNIAFEPLQGLHGIGVATSKT
jgi:hypothetical protein